MLLPNIADHFRGFTKMVRLGNLEPTLGVEIVSLQENSSKKSHRYFVIKKIVVLL